MSELYCITVSTNYADLLELIIDQNQKFFTKWYIITVKDDKKTLDVIKKANYEHIEVLFFDFKQGGYKFNKGGAIQMAQNLVMEKHGEGVNVLIVDSDIYIPDEFSKIYNEMSVEPNKLYSISKRIDYYKYSDFIKKINGNIHFPSLDFIGCFQLYKQDKNKLYTNSDSCETCDLSFRDKFMNEKMPTINWNDFSITYHMQRVNYYIKHNCIYLPLTIYHLGHHYINWNGRVANTDFINDREIENNTKKENKFIDRTLRIYEKKMPTIYNKTIAKCKFLENNKLEVKLDTHTTNGIYYILDENVIKITYYSYEFICILNNEEINMNVLYTNTYTNYYGLFVR